MVRASSYHPALRLGLATAALCVAAGPAHAHLVDMRFGDFYGGALHLITGVQYVLLLLAVSVVAGLQPVARARWALLVVPLCVGVGAGAALVLPAYAVTHVLAISTFCIGAVIALGLSLPFAVFLALCISPALLVGYENGIAAAAAQDTHLFIAALVLTAFMWVCLATALVVTLRPRADWSVIALRAVGSWLAAVSLIFLTLNLAQGPASTGDLSAAADAGRAP